MKTIVVLVTAPHRAASQKLSRLLVERKLAACVNILPGVSSRYWWKGKIVTAPEELLIIKTEKSKWSLLSKTIRENHPYEVCEILQVPVTRGNQAYLKWITESLRK